MLSSERRKRRGEKIFFYLLVAKWKENEKYRGQDISFLESRGCSQNEENSYSPSHFLSQPNQGKFLIFSTSSSIFPFLIFSSFLFYSLDSKIKTKPALKKCSPLTYNSYATKHKHVQPGIPSYTPYPQSYNTIQSAKY